MRRAFVVLTIAALLAGNTSAAQQPAPALLADSLAQQPAAAFAPTGMTLSAEKGDTVRRRPRAFEVTDAYALRLRVHRYASYATIPLFVLQSVAGNQLFQADKSGAERPGWAKSVHSSGALGLSALFGLNTVTGVWNLWESRGNEVGRTKRLLHSAIMLASDAGFADTGLKLADDAKHSADGRQDHRKLAYYSMGVALAGYGMMYLPER